MTEPTPTPYDRRVWETYSRDAGCGCTAPDPNDCAVDHSPLAGVRPEGQWAFMCVCHRLSAPPADPIRNHFTDPNRCTSVEWLFRCGRPVGHPGQHRAGRTFWCRRPDDDTTQETDR